LRTRFAGVRCEFASDDRVLLHHKCAFVCAVLACVQCVAPYIVFDPIDGEKGVKLELKEVPVFASDDADLGETLFDYDNGKFKPVKAPNMGIAWPSGDGRRIKMTGTKGYYAQPNLKEYGPFPDFFKRSCDG